MIRLDSRTYAIACRLMVTIAELCLVIGAASGCSANSDSDSAISVEPTEPIVSGSVSASGFGDFQFVARDGNVLTIKYYRATQFSADTDPIWFVMHGVSRAAEHYIEIAAPVAERHNAIALTIHFPEALYHSSTDYTLNVAKYGRPDGTALAQGRWKEPEFYLFSEVERVFDAVRTAISGKQHGYYIFGHSAGAQFTHRLLTFLPEHRVLRAVAANAGWYTLPVSRAEAAYTIPYGLHNSPVDDSMRRRLTDTAMTILVGERDTATPSESRLVRGSPEAMAQGRNRVERGQNYFRTSQAAAQRLDAPFNWNFAIVPRAGHSARPMIASAAHFLFESNTSLCTPSTANSAADLRITEILADPPTHQVGDANNDTVRDSIADEFIELKNLGTEPVCLSGWSIGDASKTERHVFPLGTLLGGQQTIVVFGGGQPTGDFNGALVQWAAFDDKLSLTNEGDVVTVRDAENTVIDQVSWGNCAEQVCSENHYPESLNIARSIVRGRGSDQIWEPYSDDETARFAPGYAENIHQEANAAMENHDQRI